MIFPFGQTVRNVEQADRTPKKIFCLGVYSSAVHAKWLSPEGRVRIRALAVASEPYIFWRGDNAGEIITAINVPAGAGTLVPADDRLNGPSGNTLDEQYIEPLKAFGKNMSRNGFWLCDLLPQSCMNDSQKKAVEREYLPIAGDFNLPLPTICEVPGNLAGPERQAQIRAELIESQARIIMLLGDQPIKYFLSYIAPQLARYKDLNAFGKTRELYGRLHELQIDGSSYYILPLAHCRQAGALGHSDPEWASLHEYWAANVAPKLLNDIFPAQ